MPKMKDVTITKVDLVPQGANEFANILLYKSKDKGGNYSMEELIKQLLQDKATEEIGLKLEKELKDLKISNEKLEKELKDEKALTEKLNKEVEDIKKSTDAVDEKSEEEIIKTLDPALQSIFKKQKMQAEAAEKIAKELKEERDNKMFASIAKSLNVTNEQEMTEVLKEVSKNCDERIYNLLEKELKAKKEQIKKSNLFTEIGSDKSNEIEKTTWDEIVRKSKEVMIAKGNNGKTEEEIIDLFLETTEGQKMYEKYLSNT